MGAMRVNALEMNEIKNEMKANAQQMENKMDGNTNDMKGEMKEMRRVGQCLQAGIMALACDETRTAGEKMATPRAGANELRGSALAVRPAMEASWGF